MQKKKKNQTDLVQVILPHVTHTAGTARYTQGVSVGNGGAEASLSVLLKASSTKTQISGAWDSKGPGGNDY